MTSGASTAEGHNASSSGSNSSPSPSQDHHQQQQPPRYRVNLLAHLKAHYPWREQDHQQKKQQHHRSLPPSPTSATTGSCSSLSAPSTPCGSPTTGGASSGCSEEPAEAGAAQAPCALATTAKHAGLRLGAFVASEANSFFGGSSRRNSRQPTPRTRTRSGSARSSSTTSTPKAAAAGIGRMESESGDYASMDGDVSMGASGQSSACSGPVHPPHFRDREGSGISSYVRALEGPDALASPPVTAAANCGSVVEHSPQGRYVRFNFRIEACAYKEVWKAFDTSEGVEVAWNSLCLDEVPRSDKKRILNEIKILEKLDHPNIITFYTSWYNKETRRIVFITELMNNNNNGSLMEFVKPIPVLRWKIVKRWLRQMLEGLAFLHGQAPPIIHRNINCDNIFIIANTGELKIGDLGLSTAAQRPEGCVGTAPFMAPELFEEDYDEKVDIYAFGMAILQMITKKQPYSECENRVGEVYQRVTNHIPPESLATVDLASARAFVELCLEPEPTERPSARELLEHKFLKEDKVEDGLEVIINKPAPQPTPSTAAGGTASPIPASASAGSLTGLAISGAGGDGSGAVAVPGTGVTRSTSHESTGGLAASSVGSDGRRPSVLAGETGDLGDWSQSSAGQGAKVQVSNGSKLHLRFFSEPHGSYSEMSSDDGAGDSDLDEEGGAEVAAIEASMGDGSLLASHSGASLIQTGVSVGAGGVAGAAGSMRSRGLSLDPDVLAEGDYVIGAEPETAALHWEEATIASSTSRSGRAGSGAGGASLALSLSGLGSFYGGHASGGGTQPSRSPRSLLRDESLGSNDDDLLSEMPTAESSIKKVKVMGARGTELVEDEGEGGKDKARTAAAAAAAAADGAAAGGAAGEEGKEGAGAASKPAGGGLTRSKLSTHNMQQLLANAISEGMMRRSPSAATLDEMQRKGSFFNASASGAGGGLMRRTPSSSSSLEAMAGSSTSGNTSSRAASPTASPGSAASAASLQQAGRPPVAVPAGGLPPKSPATRALLAKGVPGGGKKAHFNVPDGPGGWDGGAASSGTATPEPPGAGGPPETLPRLSSYNLSVVEASSSSSSAASGSESSGSSSGGDSCPPSPTRGAGTGKPPGPEEENATSLRRLSSEKGQSGGPAVQRASVQGAAGAGTEDGDDASSVHGSICSGSSEEDEDGHHHHHHHHHHPTVTRRLGESTASTVAPAAAVGVEKPGAAPGGVSKGRVMTLLIQTLVKGKPTEVEFEFDLDADSPQAVAREMVQELDIPLREMEGLGRQIKALREEVLAKREARKAAKAAGRLHPAAELPSPSPALGPPGAPQPIPPGAPVGMGPPSGGPGMVTTSYAAMAAGTASAKAGLAPTPAGSKPPAGVGALPAGAGGRPMSVSAPLSVGTGTGTGTGTTEALPLESLQGLRLTDIDVPDEEDEEEDAQDLELQRLKQEYIKSVQRAQKAFRARMESMYKCREDKEEWHRKLLEQYERAMSDFDRRLHTATDDQTRRLSELRAQFASARTQHVQSKQQQAALLQQQTGPAPTPGSMGSAASTATGASTSS